MKTILSIIAIIIAGIIVVFALNYAAAPATPSPLPSPSAPAGYETHTDEQSGVTFQYPVELQTTYIHVLDWPPQVRVFDEPFSCQEAGQEIDRAGRTQLRTVEDRQYCRTLISEGAAGSIYDQYAYKTALPEGRSAIFTFTTRKVQCANYDDPQKSECEGERETFDIDSVADRIIQSAQIP